MDEEVNRPAHPGVIRDSGESQRWVPAVAAMSGKLARQILDLVLPPTCPITGESVEKPGYLSAKGWAAIRFIDDPVCARCGVPFASDYGEGFECAACIAEPPSFDRARAAVVYDDASRKLIVGFKHSDRTELGPLLGQWLARAGGPLIRTGTIIIPAPLHPRRLLARRFNQAGLLASVLAEKLGARVLLDGLKRVRATPPQQGLSRSARRENVGGAFAVNEERRVAFGGGEILLNDDVLTTGETLSACARALKKAGAVAVDALVLARTVRGGLDAL
ncbi:MAG: ComF family protein [Parvularculaceae bacterium]